MPFHEWEDIASEFVTPKHSTAFGRLVTGEQVEVGWLTFKKGEGANEHAHPHEQIIIPLSGRVRMTLGGETREVVRGMAVHVPPNVPHSSVVLEDAEAISCKGIVGGVGHKI